MKKRRAETKRGNPDPTVLDEYSRPGTVITVFPDDYACRVRDDLEGATHDVALPGLIQDPEGSGGEIYVPRAGQRVELKFGGGARPRVSGFLPQSFDVNITSNETPPLFEGSQGRLNIYGNAPNSFRGYMPTGLLPGDWCRLGNLGQHVGVFDGGVSVLHGSKWAQVRAVGSQGADTLSLFGRRMDIHTDFGDIIFGSDGGKSYVEFLGGTDQTLESGVDRQNWTVRAAVGKGEGLANFAILDREGNAVLKKVIGADGTLGTTQSGDKADVFTGSQSIAYERAFTRSVLDGDDTLNVTSGSRVENYGRNQFTNVTNNREVNVLADDSVISGGNMFRSCKTHDLSIEGRLTAVPGDAAATWKVANGDLNIEIGKLPADLQKSASSFNVTAYPPNAKISMRAPLGYVETFSAIETKIESSALMNLFAGGAFKAEAGGVMQLKAGGAMTADITGAMQMNSGGPAMFGSSAMVQLGSTGAVEPVLKGQSVLSSISAFATACSLAGKGAGIGSSSGLNGAAIIAIGLAADSLLGALGSWPSVKVFTE